MAYYRRFYRFFWSWESRRGEDGRPVLWADVLNFEEDRAAAVRAHEKACEGGWVTSKMEKPTVGPLVEYLVPDDDSPSTMSRETEGGVIRKGKDLWHTDLKPEFTSRHLTPPDPGAAA